MILSEYRTESDESAGMDEYDESDEFGEAPSRFRSFPRITPGKTGTGQGLYKPRPSTQQYVTQAQLEAGLARVGTQISANSEAIKKVASQASKFSADLATATTRLEKQTGENRKELKKQGEMSLLMTLLQKPPALKTETQTVTVPDPADSNKTKDITLVTKVEHEKQSNLLPLVLLAGSGGFGGGGDNSNILILALALSGQI